VKVYRAAHSFSQQVGQQLERGGVYAPHLMSIAKYALSKWYSINLSDDQWVIIAPLTPSRKPDRQPRITDMRAVFNADWLLSARAASGICCRATIGHFGPFTATSRHGNAAVRGKPSTTVCGVTCADSLDAG
jgi:hypothetical protein